MARTLTDDDLAAIAELLAPIQAGVAILTTMCEQADKGLPTEYTRWQARALEQTPDSAGVTELLTRIPDATPGMAGGVSTLLRQDVRDAMALALSAGIYPVAVLGHPQRDSIDTKLGDILEDTGLIDAIKLRTDTIGAGTVTAVSPVAAGGNATIDQGYDYYAADGRALNWADDTPATWPDLSGAAAKFYCGRLVAPGTISNPAGPATVTVELSRTQTAALPIGKHPFHVDLSLANGHVILQIAGIAWIRRWAK